MAIFAATAFSLLVLSISSGFLLLGITLTGIENRSFIQALKATTVGYTVSILASLGIGPLCIAVGYLAASLVTVEFFKTTLGNALLANIVPVVLNFSVGLLALLLIATQGNRFAPFIYSLF